MKIANSFIDNAISRTNTTVMKLVWYIAANIKDHNFELPMQTHRFDEKDIQSKTGVSIVTIRRNLEVMMNTQITFTDDEMYEYEKVSLLSRVAPLYNGEVDIDLHSYIVKNFHDVSSNYTFVPETVMYKLENAHSMRLLPLLYKINGNTPPARKTQAMKLDELNSFFGQKRTLIKQFQGDILNKVKKELDEKSELSFDFEYVMKKQKGKGRPTAIGIRIIPKLKVNETIIPKELPPIKLQTLEEIAETKIIDLSNRPLIQKNIDRLIPQDKLSYEMRNFIDFCITNKKRYPDYAQSFLRHIEKKYDTRINNLDVNELDLGE